ncbi:MAG: hypothetical protein E7638_02230 [Ruminococcaceae bacterium]|nr:hypothetical protein [Oscillospiraceae bacterium]
MEQTALQVCMFGGFSVTYKDKTIRSDTNRAKTVWTLLTYLFYHRDRSVSPEELLSLMHFAEKGNANPSGALKTALFRVRSTLDQLGDGMGKHLLKFRNGGYFLNPDVEMHIDREGFDALLLSIADPANEGNKLQLFLDALSLYGGEFCCDKQSETWIIPIAAYYQNCYVRLVDEAVPLLEASGRHNEGAAICRRALELDPYNETFYQHLMRCLLALEQRSEVVTVYEDMSKLLLSNFGVMPDQESRALYREALRTVNLTTISPGTLMERLREEMPVSGALVCDYDFFRNVYQAQARMIARSGDAVHVSLFTVSGRLGKTPAKRSMEIAMDNLEKHLARSLRKGDMVTRCSSAQFVIMLPQANYEDSCKVCDRLVDSFFRQYPHAPVRIDYYVQALEPTTNG